MEEVALSKPLTVPVFSEEERRCLRNIVSPGLTSREKKLICVTGGNSLLGSSIVKELSASGYLVRVIIENTAHFEDVKKLMREEELNSLEGVVVAKMGDMESLCQAFRGCHAVFHSSSSIDPHGISGYNEPMAFLEREWARNVVEACGKAAYVKRCIFTSSLLASIWRGDDVNGIVDDSSWSSEDYCRENKLWLALGKTTAEKVAWEKSKELRVNLVTICPGLLGETCLPYLKGGRIMLERGVLAVANVKKVAEAHVLLYEAMDHGACGRYLCYENVLRRLSEAIELERKMKMPGLLSGGGQVALLENVDREIQCNISNSKLVRVLLQASKYISCKE